MSRGVNAKWFFIQLNLETLFAFTSQCASTCMLLTDVTTGSSQFCPNLFYFPHELQQSYLIQTLLI